MRAGNERASGNNIVIPVAANTTITEGHMVAIESDGYAAEATKAENLTIAGCAMKYTDNSAGNAGDVTVPVRRGTFVWNNDGSIKATDILKTCYVADAQTVTITATGSSKAGTILGVEGDGVIVETL